MCNKEQISHNEFLEDVKDLLRRSIAAKLDINQVLLLGNFSAQQTVEEKLTVIMAKALSGKQDGIGACCERIKAIEPVYRWPGSQATRAER